MSLTISVGMWVCRYPVLIVAGNNGEPGLKEGGGTAVFPFKLPRSPGLNWMPDVKGHLTLHGDCGHSVADLTPFVVVPQGNEVFLRVGGRVNYEL